MIKILRNKLLLVAFLVGFTFTGNAQDLSTFQQNQTQGLIVVADAGQLADTLNLWGDVRATGKYLVPRGTNLIDLISYARGPVGATARETWANINLQIFISRYNEQANEFRNQSFELKLNEPLPQEMKRYPLRNGDVITVKADRKPNFRDYFTIIAPVLSLGLTAFIAVDRLSAR